MGRYRALVAVPLVLVWCVLVGWVASAALPSTAQELTGMLLGGIAGCVAVCWVLAADRF